MGAKGKEKYIEPTLGPGEYTLPEKVNGPHWSLQSKNKVEMKINNIGPGQYNPQDQSKNIQIAIKGEKNPDDNSKNFIPGPGAYSSKSTLNQEGVTMGMKLLQEPKSSNVGPGKYNIPTNTKGPEWTIQEKHQIKSLENDLGPGQYNIKEIECSKQGHVFRGRNHTEKEDENPGPGHYDPKCICCQSQKGITIAPKFKEKGGEVTIGPGNYNPNHQITKQQVPMWTIQGKYSEEVGSYNIGPGEYNLDQKSTHIGISMKGDRKQLNEIDNLPGPGAYDAGSTLNLNGVTIGERFDDKEDPSKLGPGKYNLPTTNTTKKEAPHWSIKGKYEAKIETNGVGPGQYTIEEKPTKLGPTLRGRLGQENVDNNIPGPGYYDAKSTLKNEGFTMNGRNENKQIVHNAPGPGTYNLPDTEVNHEGGPEWTIKGKYPEKIELSQVGPGYYRNPDYNPPKEGISMKGTKKIPEAIDNKVPGPGYYQTKSTLNPNGVSIQGKYDIKQGENYGPGPGFYSLPNAEINHEEFPKWTIQGRNPLKEKEAGIGPGYYNNPDYKDVPIGYTMQGRINLEKENDNPGPGYYNVKYPKGNDGVTLKSRIWLKEKEDEGPPPGGYYNTPDIELNHKK
mmetsp:Transcript_9826/g.8654  ORF Transcript_9826/g.8654 Transcript_9826/m.8654 type:complete len:619 (-) Transcript_9826:2997-4853(-)